MAVFVTTNDSNELLQEIKKAIDDRTIVTWEYDSDGDFTHSPDQWKNKAWMRPHVEEGKIVFGIVDRKDINLTITEYAVFHGRFVEMLLEHFDRKCSDIRVSPLGTTYDIIKVTK